MTVGCSLPRIVGIKALSLLFDFNRDMYIMCEMHWIIVVTDFSCFAVKFTPLHLVCFLSVSTSSYLLYPFPFKERTKDPLDLV